MLRIAALVSSIVSLLMAFSSMASAETALLEKFQDAGYTMAQHYQTFSCSIYADRVEIQRTFGGDGIGTHEVRAIQWTGAVADLVAKARLETFEAEPTICDGPQVSIQVPRQLSGDEYLIFGSSTCNVDGKRKGEASTVLINIVNALCGEM